MCRQCKIRAVRCTSRVYIYIWKIADVSSMWGFAALAPIIHGWIEQAEATMTFYKQKISEKTPFSIAHALAKPIAACCCMYSYQYSKIISYSNKSALLCHTYRMEVCSYWSRQLFASYNRVTNSKFECDRFFS